MNGLQKAYCDGASMAYKDAADKLFDMIAKAPNEIAGFMDAFKPFATALMEKANKVYEVTKELNLITSKTIN